MNDGQRIRKYIDGIPFDPTREDEEQVKENREILAEFDALLLELKKYRNPPILDYAGSALEEVQSLPPVRRTVQISSQIDSHGKYLVLAICNDGTIWQLDNLYREGGKEPFWFPFPIPPWMDAEDVP